MSGILAVYSLVIAVLVANDMGRQDQNYTLFKYVLPQRPPSFCSQFQRLYASRVWALCWIDKSGGRICDRDSRRYGSTLIHEAVEDLCGHGPDLDFC